MTTTIDWTREDSEDAIREGWDIFDCDGSDNGPWQICRLDEADDPHWLGDDGTVPPQHERDVDVWMIVCTEFSALHLKALYFIQEHNPQEYTSIMTWYKDHKVGDNE